MGASCRLTRRPAPALATPLTKCWACGCRTCWHPGSGRSIRPFHLLNALESCSELFTRYGGHSHAVGFTLPSARVPELCQRLDQYARARLTLADFDPALELDAQLRLEQITPELFRAVLQLEPFGVGNREPIFAASNVRLMAPPQIMKDKHVRLKLSFTGEGTQDELSETAVLVTPRCHPDSAAIRRTERREPRTGNWRKAITYDALGWHMAERLQQSQLLPGDTLDIAFSLEQNDDPNFGGLELSLRDFRTASGKLNLQAVTGQT